MQCHQKEIRRTGRDWDETAIDPVVTCDTAEPAHLRVMVYHKNITRPLYAQARLTAEHVTHKTVTFVLCDSNYNVKQPVQLVSRIQVIKQANEFEEGWKLHTCRIVYFMFHNVFSTQSLQLPSGYILPPGTSLHQVSRHLLMLL
jgi:hypothetical protein